MKNVPPIPKRPRFQASSGFSLIELLTVIGIISILLALSVPGMISTYPSRKTSIYEVKGFLESARSEAVARKREVYVAFADSAFPGDSGPYRAYASFAAVEGDKHGVIGDQELEQISEWRSLPEGIIFVHGEHFEILEGASFRTVFDSSFRRDFTSRMGDGEIETARLPFLLFSTNGRVLVPSYFEVDALHVGIAEGHYERDDNALVFTGRRPSLDGEGMFPQTECIALEYYTGRSRVITD